MEYSMTSILWQSIRMVLVPPRCVSCELLSPIPTVAGLCPVCLPLCEPNTERRCRRCDLPLPTMGPIICRRCLTSKPPFNHLRAPFLYGGPLAEALTHFKFRDRVDLGQGLAQLMSRDSWVDALLADATMVVPIPLSPKRLRNRKHNQAAILARHLVKHRPIRVIHGLKRVRDTPPQSSLSLVERQTNLHGAFAPTKKVENESIVLIDDVVTTTQTVREAARILKVAGARRVTVIAAARASKTTALIA